MPFDKIIDDKIVKLFGLNISNFLSRQFSMSAVTR